LQQYQGKSFIPPHVFCWKSLQPCSPACPETAIRDEGKRAAKMRLSQNCWLSGCGFRTHDEPFAQNCAIVKFLYDFTCRA
jgi:hypothetical protein